MFVFVVGYWFFCCFDLFVRFCLFLFVCFCFCFVLFWFGLGFFFFLGGGVGGGEVRAFLTCYLTAIRRYIFVFVNIPWLANSKGPLLVIWLLNSQTTGTATSRR